MGRDSPHYVLWTTFFMVTASCRSLTAHYSERKPFSQHGLRDAEGSRVHGGRRGRVSPLPCRALRPVSSPLCVRRWLVPGVAEEVSLFPALLLLPDMGLLGHRCFTSHDRGGGDFITPAGSSVKRLGSLPFPQALLAECFRLSFPAITLLGICLKGLILKKEKKGSVPSWSPAATFIIGNPGARQVCCNGS